MIYLVYLIYERGHLFQESCLIVINKDVELNPMFPAGKKGLAIIATTGPSVSYIDQKVITDASRSCLTTSMTSGLGLIVSIFPLGI